MPSKPLAPREKPAALSPPRIEDLGQGHTSHRVALYARVSTQHQQTIPLQLRALSEYASRRGWSVVMEASETRSGVKQRPERDRVLAAARRRDIDAIAVWRLDRWGRSVSDLVATLQELEALGVAFVSLQEAFDLTTPTGRAMAAMIAVFAQFEREIRRERVAAGIEAAKRAGRRPGPKRSASLKAEAVMRLHGEGVPKAKIARQLNIGRTTVRRILELNA